MRLKTNEHLCNGRGSILAQWKVKAVPEEPTDNSSAFQRRVQGERNARPEGTTEITPDSAVPHATLAIHRTFPALKRRGYCQLVLLGQTQLTASRAKTDLHRYAVE